LEQIFKCFIEDLLEKKGQLVERDKFASSVADKMEMEEHREQRLINWGLGETTLTDLPCL
jgi:hypothetical protein